MIQSKTDLKEYLEADRIALGRDRDKPFFTDLVWRYEISLRKNEFYYNCRRGILWRPMKIINNIKLSLLGILCGFELPLNRIGKGLSIAHKGTIIMSPSATIGENCRLHVGVNIGTVPGCPDVAPKIGDNVYIAPGVKLYGKIEIGSGIMIGANSVVNRSFTDENITIAGIPARKISDIGRFEKEKRNRLLYSHPDL